MIKLDRVSELPWGSEAREYLEGVLAADPAHRMDTNPHRNIRTEISKYGSATPAFWRGVIETAGSAGFGLSQAPDSSKTQIWVKLSGSYWFLLAFLDFCEEEIQQKNHKMWPFDSDGKLARQAPNERLVVYGKQAQEIVCALYPPGYEMCRESSRETVERIRQHMWRR